MLKTGIDSRDAISDFGSVSMLVIEEDCVPCSTACDPRCRAWNTAYFERTGFPANL